MPTSHAFKSLLGVAIAAVVVPSPSSQANQPVIMDSLAKATLEEWTELEYRPSVEQLRGGSVVLRVDGKSRGQNLEGMAMYVWESTEQQSSSSLEWRPAKLGHQMATEGWSKEIIDHLFLVTDEFANYADCTLTANAQDGNVIISVNGRPSNGVRTMTFGPTGVLAKVDYEFRQGGLDLRYSVEPTFEERSGRFVKSKEMFKMNMGGEVVSTSIFSYVEIDGVLMPSKVEETSTWNGFPSGSKTITWTDWIIMK